MKHNILKTIFILSLLTEKNCAKSNDKFVQIPNVTCMQSNVAEEDLSPSLIWMWIQMEQKMGKDF